MPEALAVAIEAVETNTGKELSGEKEPTATSVTGRRADTNRSDASEAAEEEIHVDELFPLCVGIERGSAEGLMTNVRRPSHSITPPPASPTAAMTRTADCCCCLVVEGGEEGLRTSIGWLWCCLRACESDEATAEKVFAAAAETEPLPLPLLVVAIRLPRIGDGDAAADPPPPSL